MSNDSIPRRMLEKLLEEINEDHPAWYWMSFVDPKRPKGDRFLGVAIVHAVGPTGAIVTSHDLGVNPGGEVGIERLPEDFVVPPAYRERLLSRADLEKMKEEIDGSEI